MSQKSTAPSYITRVCHSKSEQKYISFLDGRGSIGGAYIGMVGVGYYKVGILWYCIVLYCIELDCTISLLIVR